MGIVLGRDRRDKHDKSDKSDWMDFDWARAIIAINRVDGIWMGEGDTSDGSDKSAGL